LVTGSSSARRDDAPVVKTAAESSQVERTLGRVADIAINEAKHGPVDDERYTYKPTFILRGLTDLNIRFTPLR
jgi:hypothetical protein